MKHSLHNPSNNVIKSRRVRIIVFLLAALAGAFSIVSFAKSRSRNDLIRSARSVAIRRFRAEKIRSDEVPVTINGSDKVKTLSLIVSSLQSGRSINVSITRSSDGNFYFTGNGLAQEQYRFTVANKGYLANSCIREVIDDDLDEPLSFDLIFGDVDGDDYVSNTDIEYIRNRLDTCWTDSGWSTPLATSSLKVELHDSEYLDSDADGQITIYDLEAAEKNLGKSKSP